MEFLLVSSLDSRCSGYNTSGIFIYIIIIVHNLLANVGDPF